jgi:hypothetical protein
VKNTRPMDKYIPQTEVRTKKNSWSFAFDTMVMKKWSTIGFKGDVMLEYGTIVTPRMS